MRLTIVISCSRWSHFITETGKAVSLNVAALAHVVRRH